MKTCPGKRGSSSLIGAGANRSGETTSVATTMDDVALRKQLEELYLVKCSLLPGEQLVFGHEDDAWTALLDAYPLDDSDDLPVKAPIHPAHLQVKTKRSPVWFDVVVPATYGSSTSTAFSLSVTAKCERWTRHEQEQWRETTEQLLSKQLQLATNECVQPVGL